MSKIPGISSKLKPLSSDVKEPALSKQPMIGARSSIQSTSGMGSKYDSSSHSKLFKQSMNKPAADRK